MALSFFKLCILSLVFFEAKGQETVFFGASASYNLSLNTYAAGLRINIPLGLKVIISPQVRYTPRIKDFHEFSLGPVFHYYFINPVQYKGRYVISSPVKPSFYISVGISYHRWINYTLSLNSHAKKDNILPEPGIGIVSGNKGCRFFIEGKYNALWLEPHIEAGLIFFPFNGGNPLKNSCPY